MATCNDNLDLCRLCAKETIPTESLQIFGNLGKFRTIEAKISSCLSIIVNEFDELPKVICTDCGDKIDSYYGFKIICSQTQSLLQELFERPLKTFEENHVEPAVLPVNNSEFIDIKEPFELFNNDESSLDEFSDTEHSNLYSNHDDIDPLEDVDSVDTADVSEPTVVNNTVPNKPSVNVNIVQPNFINPPTIAQLVKLCSINKNDSKQTNSKRLSSTDTKYSTQNNLNENRNVNSSKNERYKIFESTCPYCLKDFVSEASYIVHIQRHQKIETEPFKCTFCPKTFKCAPPIIAHIKLRHTRELDFKCPHCEWRFVNISRLKYHIECRHDQNKPQFKCNVCSKIISGKQSFKNHIIHHNEFYYHCNFCSKKYKQLKQKIRHIKKHHTVEFHIHCNQCDMQFVSNEELKKHVEIKHNGNQTIFVCKICKRISVGKRAFIAHKACYHPGSSISSKYTCSYCDKNYKLKKSLQQHIFKKHQQDEPSSSKVQ